MIKGNKQVTFSKMFFGGCVTLSVFLLHIEEKVDAFNLTNE